MNNHDDNDNDGDHVDRWYLSRPSFVNSTDFSGCQFLKSLILNIEEILQTNKNKGHSKLWQEKEGNSASSGLSTKSNADCRLVKH